jgi:hypothetical protein
MQEKLCHTCGAPVQTGQPAVSVHGLTFHAACAGYTRRPGA